MGNVNGIIAKIRLDWWKVGIIVIASILRIYRLEAFTEFLGDQGRTMLVMRDFVERGVVPLSGPTTLTGHHLGPIFYYLLIPGYIIGGSPISVAAWMACLGVVSVAVLYDTIHRMFGVWSARVVSILWVASPFILTSDRVIWEPNLVPLFVLLYINILYRVHRENSKWLWVALGTVVGVLVQLHYPNVFFIGLTGLVFVGMAIFRYQKIYKVIETSLWWLLGFVLILLPFLWYEYTVGFKDITGMISIFIGGSGDVISKRMMLQVFSEAAFRMFGRAIPCMSSRIVWVVLAVWSIYLCFRKTKINIFLSIWLFGGLINIARYNGVLHDHYLYFLVPVPFFMIASVLSSIASIVWKYVAVFVVGVICVLQFAKTDILAFGNNDIYRVRESTNIVKSEVGNTSFSFTLINSRSFSDLHYRYYMKVAGLNPLPVTDRNYRILVILCDNQRCPTVGELTSKTTIPILCYEYHCRELYPDISLGADWMYMKDEPVLVNDVAQGTLYIFRRR